MVGNGIKAKVAAAIAQDEGGHAQRHPSDQVEEMHVEVQQVVSDEQPHRHRAYCQREYPAGSPQHMVDKGEKAIAVAASIAVGHCRQRAIEKSEEHTSELQSLMRISYAVFCL